MKKTKDNNEVKSLVEEKKNIWRKIKKWFNEILFFNKKEIHINKPNSEEKRIKKEYNITPSESSNIVTNIIKQAKTAYENYILNNEYEIAETLYKYVEERINANKNSIGRVIEINKETLTFNKILDLLNNEKNNLDNYKKTIRSTKLDDKFMFSQYLVPVGIIAIETQNCEKIITNIFKALTTRNSIVIIKEKNNEYSTDNLVLLIVKECLNKFNIDNNIIQIVEINEIKDIEKKEFDIFIDKEGNIQEKEYTNKLYIYQEDEYFENIIKEEVKNLNLIGKKVEVLTGEFYDCLNKINKTRNYGVSIYSQDRKKGYKFINLINSKNVFFNTTLKKAKEPDNIGKTYLISKNIVCEYK